MDKNDLFSIRMGLEPNQAMQVGELDTAARNAIYNALDPVMPEIYDDDIRHIVTGWRHDLWSEIGKNYYDLLYDQMFIGYGQPASYDGSRLWQKYKVEYKNSFNKLFDFIEFVYQTLLEIRRADDKAAEEITSILEYIDDNMNHGLKRTNVGYRFLKGQFVPLVTDDEREEIARANETPFQNANEHIKKATAFFSDRENPDYANSIKESISAAEAAVKELTGDDKATLGKGLKKLEASGIKLHPAFKGALSQLYGFTSDEAGIRHAKTGKPVQVDQATARFMLIVCSAFVNYIIANAPSKP